LIKADQLSERPVYDQIASLQRRLL